MAWSFSLPCLELLAAAETNYPLLSLSGSFSYSTHFLFFDTIRMNPSLKLPVKTLLRGQAGRPRGARVTGQSLAVVWHSRLFVYNVKNVKLVYDNSDPRFQPRYGAWRGNTSDAQYTSHLCPGRWKQNKRQSRTLFPILILSPATLGKVPCTHYSARLYYNNAQIPLNPKYPQRRRISPARGMSTSLRYCLDHRRLMSRYFPAVSVG